MRDDYDNKFLKHSNINCTLCRSLKWTFFTGAINRGAEEEVINHLLVCPKCLAEYTKYAKEINWGTFDIIDIATKFKEKYKETTKLKEDSWLKNFKDEKVVKLARSKAIRQVMLGEKDLNFTNFLIERICKTLDKLEACYAIEEGDEHA